jgi:CubicO group peptidase (beta-lactamase class C family)
MKPKLFTLLVLLFTNCQAQQTENPIIKELKSKITDKTYPKIDGIVIRHNDKIIVEEYFNGFKKDTPHEVRSSFKSITSILAGIAIDKKLMTLSDNLGRFFPELKDAEKRKITVQDLLEMRSGLNCEEYFDIGPECEDKMMQSEDWIAFCLGVDLIRKPGLNWSYNSNDPMIVGGIIAKASGMKIEDFARENLFEPLGIKDYKWTFSPKGQAQTAGSFYMKPIDFLKIIDMVKNEGNWNGKQLVSADWIKKSTDCHIPIDFSFTRFSKIPDAIYESARYGFFWYKENLKYKDINTEVLFSSGNGGQYMMWIPEYKMTVVFTGSNYGNWRGKLPFEILLKYIIPSVKKENRK